jgi:hypothetical protein
MGRFGAMAEDARTIRMAPGFAPVQFGAGAPLPSVHRAEALRRPAQFSGMRTLCIEAQRLSLTRAHPQRQQNLFAATPLNFQPSRHYVLKSNKHIPAASTATEGGSIMDESLCPHLVESAHFEQPFAFIAASAAAAAAAVDSRPAFSCPVCTVAEVKRRMDQGAIPADISNALSFETCDHKLNRHGSHCKPCLWAILGGLQQEWAQLVFTDKPAADNLRRLLVHLGTIYHQRELKTAFQLKAAPSVPNIYREHAVKDLGLHAIEKRQAGASWLDARARRLRTLGNVPAQAVVVIPPVRATVPDAA